LSFLALPWAFLAHSQYQYPVVIQVASLSGTYGISFLIVMVNAALVAIIYPFLFKFSDNQISPNLPLPKGGVISSRGRATTTPPLTKGEKGVFGIDRGRKALVATTALLIVLVFTYGQLTLAKPIVGKMVKVSLVQGNIEQEKKWDSKYAQEIMKTYADLTQETAKDQPALIVWPETATPWSITQDARLQAEVRNIAKRAGAYLLLGSSQHQKFASKEKKGFKYFNSAFLIPSEANTTRNQRYDKIRLFPFGEYLPYRDIIPWSLIKAAALDNYTPGKEFTVFEHPDFRFGAVICWENIFPDLVRQIVKRGAQCIFNLTNEAHFGKTAAPYQLVSMCVFRAVENRIFVARCANTGISCIIDPYGRIVDRVKDERGQDIFIRGKLSGWVIPLDSKTIYTQYGDLLVWVAIFGSLVMLVVSVWKGRRK
jgi:apolipoprotein N-acyltransferase